MFRLAGLGSRHHLPLLGFIGALLLVASVVATLFDVWGKVSALSALFTIPIAVWEFSLGVYLIVQGFKLSRITAGMAGTRPACQDSPVQRSMTAAGAYKEPGSCPRQDPPERAVSEKGFVSPAAPSDRRSARPASAGRGSPRVSGSRPRDGSGHPSAVVRHPGPPPP